MKSLKKAFPFALLLLFTLFMVSCGDSPKKEKTKPTEKTEAKKPELPSTLYVIAPSGLILRQTGDLDGTRISKMPYGSAVQVISDQGGSSLKVANIPGTMLNIKFKDTTGFAYSGYLTQFSAPQNGENANQYAQRLKGDFPTVRFKSENNGSKTNPHTNLILTLPARTWSEAFLIAKQLYNIPAGFNFPRTAGPAESVVKGTPRRKNISATSLTAKRTGDSLSEITYSESGKGFGKLVQIVKMEGGFELMEQVTDD